MRGGAGGGGGGGGTPGRNAGAPCGAMTCGIALAGTRGVCSARISWAIDSSRMLVSRIPSSELFSRGNWLLIIIGVPRDDSRLDVSRGGLLVARWRLLPIFILIVGVVLGRLIFADSDTDRLMQKLLFSYEGLEAFDTIKTLPPTTKASLIIGFSLIAVEFFFRNTQMLKKRNYKHLRTPLSLVIMLIITIFLIGQGGLNFAVYGQR